MKSTNSLKTKRSAFVVLALGSMALCLFMYSSSIKIQIRSDDTKSLDSKLFSIDDKLSDIYKIVKETASRTPKVHRTRLLTNTTCLRKYKLLILVTSHLGNENRRRLIRSTWGRSEDLVRYDAHVVYLVGFSRREDVVKAITTENATYGDIIQGKVFEDFHRLAYKVEMGFEWSVLYCDYEVLLKVDDDVFVNVPRALAVYDSSEFPKVRLYLGVVHWEGEVLRNGRYGVSLDEYPEKSYRPYCAGGGFMMSRDVVERLLPHFELQEPLIIDDAYVGLLAHKAGVYPVDRYGYFRMWDDDCTFKLEAVAQHPAKTEECMKFLYSMAQKQVANLTLGTS